MPGQLRPEARCPLCEVPLVGLVDTSNSDGVAREYFHDKDPEASPRARRPLPCKQYFVSHVKAQLERAGLELPHAHRRRTN
jgi:hypothetical protein